MARTSYCALAWTSDTRPHTPIPACGTLKVWVIIA